MLRRTLPMIGLFAALISSAPVLAHHSNANYAKTEVTMKGTVVEYDWGNPHVIVIWDVKDDSGNTVRWTGDLASVSSLMADGMTKNSLKPGDDVIMTVYPAKAGTPFSVISQIRRGDGSIVLKWSRQAGGTPEERAAREAAQHQN